MAGRRRREEPARLAKARERFGAWRQTRGRGTRIPDRLWHLATGLASTYGVSRAATALGLDYYKLRERVEAAQQDSRSTQAFAELPSPAWGPGGACSIELTRGDGVCLRIQLKGHAGADLTDLVDRLWNGA